MNASLKRHVYDQEIDLTAFGAMLTEETMAATDGSYPMAFDVVNIVIPYPTMRCSRFFQRRQYNPSYTLVLILSRCRSIAEPFSWICIEYFSERKPVFLFRLWGWLQQLIDEGLAGHGRSPICGVGRVASVESLQELVWGASRRAALADDGRFGFPSPKYGILCDLFHFCTPTGHTWAIHLFDKD